MTAHRTSGCEGFQELGLHARISIGQLCILALHFHVLTSQLDKFDNCRKHSFVAILSDAQHLLQPTTNHQT